MLHTVLLISFALSSLPVRPYWKESGFIGTCAGIGCLGRRNECAIYSISGPDGVRRTYHCYMD